MLCPVISQANLLTRVSAIFSANIYRLFTNVHGANFLSIPRLWKLFTCFAIHFQGKLLMMEMICYFDGPLLYLVEI
jgi:hypothetical protein